MTICQVTDFYMEECIERKACTGGGSCAKVKEDRYRRLTAESESDFAIAAVTIETLGPTFRYARRKSGLSMAEVSRVSGVSRSALYRIEGGKDTGTISSVIGVLKWLANQGM